MTKEDSERLLEVKIKFMSAISRATMAERYMIEYCFQHIHPENFSKFYIKKIETKFRNIIRHNKEKSSRRYGSHEYTSLYL